MNRFKIGQEIEVTDNIELKSYFTEDQVQVKIGDRGFVDSRGHIHYITGNAKGKTHAIPNEVKGYDTKNIANLIWERLIDQFNIEEYLDDCYCEMEDFKDEIEDVLEDILWD